MSRTKYYDSAAAIQVIGSILNRPELLDDDGQYTFHEHDFANEFHRVIFGTAYELYNSGSTKLNRKLFEDYLRDKPKSLAIYKANNGAEWVHKAYVNAEVMNFDYYYQRLKKMSLLRAYDDVGMDVSFIYDPDNFLDTKKKQEQDESFDKQPIEEVASLIENRILSIKPEIIDADEDESCQLGNGLENLIEDLRVSPAIGYEMYDAFSSKVSMGARLGKFYLRSAGTGVGKSRTDMADACTFACSRIYKNGEWIDIGEKIPTVYISVELDKEELQTMALAFVADVPEDRILEPDTMSFDEVERVKEGIKIIEDSELYIEYLPNYGIKDVENCIKRNIRVHKVKCVVFDYLTSSIKMIEEIARGTGMKVREDQILFLLSSKLKDLAGEYDIFLLSNSQINGNFKNEKVLDQTMLAGAKAMANRIDYGEIMVDCSPDDLQDIETIVAAHPEFGVPNIKKSIYKNRRGKVNRVICWMIANKGTCRYETRFVTDFNFNYLSPSDMGIEVM